MFFKHNLFILVNNEDQLLFSDRLGLKKVRLTINLGIVGIEDSGKELFPQFLNQIALQSYHKKDREEYLILHQDIPFKIKLVITEDFDQLRSLHSKLKRLDGLIISVNIYNTQSINQYVQDSINEFVHQYEFQGLTILIGVDTYYIEKGVPSEYFRISRMNLIKKTDQLNFIYCFEIQNKDEDIKEVFNQIFNDILVKFKTSSPELLDYAKYYGQELLRDKTNQCS